MTELAAGLQGAGSPPRRNGEIVFDAPWERRVFGLAIALCRSGTIAWEEFRQRLIGQIGDDEARPYWESWASALEGVLASSAVVTPAELDARHQGLLRRPPGHDHRR